MFFYQIFEFAHTHTIPATEIMHLTQIGSFYFNELNKSEH